MKDTLKHGSHKNDCTNLRRPSKSILFAYDGHQKCTQKQGKKIPRDPRGTISFFTKALMRGSWSVAVDQATLSTPWGCMRAKNEFHVHASRAKTPNGRASKCYWIPTLWESQSNQDFPESFESFESFSSLSEMDPLQPAAKLAWIQRPASWAAVFTFVANPWHSVEGS